MLEFGDLVDLGKNKLGFGYEHPGESTPTFNDSTKTITINMLVFKFSISYHSLLYNLLENSIYKFY